ncbi:MAG TPA: deoxyribose-phosphate aldolase [Burkholderiaceae bacterium]|nr:deoxyribose-phosphate aldolase [Burkholderiaceae bacterium]
MEAKEAARIALACLDLTSLNDDDDDAAIDALVARATGGSGRPAALCVWPRFVARARAALPRAIAVAAVANFPDGALDVERALADTRAIVDAGGDEVDLVLPWRAMLGGEAGAAARLVAAVRAACPQQRLKLIIESGELPLPETIRQACRIGLAAGVDFLKTSTGKTARGASLEAARLMLEEIAAQARPVGFKASGGIRTVADAAGYLLLVREHLGAAGLVPQRLRFGASGLLGDIERVLGGAPATAPASSY